MVVLAVPAAAELTQKGDLFVHFDGGLSPRALPRNTLAPIAVRIEGTIRTLSRRHPPILRKIRLALNRGGKLSARGLPICHRQQIDPATPAKALEVCGRALVGGGGFTVKTTVEHQPQVIAPGEILLFNTKVHGHEAILAHLYETEPAPINRFIVFTIRRTGGTFGTILTSRLPESLARNAYLRSIYLQLQRSYTFRGRYRSYLSASCSAPAGIRVAAFPFARASMSFDDGRTLASTLTRTCQVLPIAG
jgi:hypothetical protein